jgi:Family of unknown function (DUF6064)
MSLPFTVDQFFGVFATYNRAVWPAQVLLYALGLVLAIFGYLGRAHASRLIALGLALLWAWMGGVYQLSFFRRINPAASVFGAAFLLQAVLFGVWGLTRRPGAVGRLSGARVWVGGALLGYALAVYPLLGWLLGHRYPSSPTFGLPCPTTIATLGLLVWVAPPPPWWLLVVPLLWVLVGSSAAFALGIREDFGLLVAGIAASAWLWHRSRHRPLIGSDS